MARTEVPVTQITLAGVEDPAATAGNASEGNFVAGNDGRTFLTVENADASNTHKVTVITPATAGGMPIEDDIITVGKSSKVKIGPYPPQVFNQSNGQLYVNVDSAELKIRAFHL
jgi:hypothetical protein